MSLSHVWNKEGASTRLLVGQREGAHDAVMTMWRKEDVSFLVDGHAGCVHPSGRGLFFFFAGIFGPWLVCSEDHIGVAGAVLQTLCPSVPAVQPCFMGVLVRTGSGLLQNWARAMGIPQGQLFPAGKPELPDTKLGSLVLCGSGGYR